MTAARIYIVAVLAGLAFFGLPTFARFVMDATDAAIDRWRDAWRDLRSAFGKESGA